MTETPVLEFENLAVAFDSPAGRAHALRGFDLTLAPGEIAALVGESGSGKSVACLAACGLLDRGADVRGAIRFLGRDVLSLGESERRLLRGREMAMVFQDPMTALNPHHTVGSQIAEMFVVHRHLTRKDAMTHAVEWLERCHIESPERAASSYPHELSGGMRQRVLIAMALALDPKVVFADEPTTALDVTTQRHVLSFFSDLVRASGAAVLFVTHDLGVAAELADSVHVMYAGRIVESGPTGDVITEPLHPYTRGLLAAVPRLDAPKGTMTAALRGQPPPVTRVDGGCAFAERCDLAIARCTAELPRLASGGTRQVRCPVVLEGGAGA